MSHQYRSVSNWTILASLNVLCVASGCSTAQDKTTTTPLVSAVVEQQRTRGEDWPVFLGPRGDGTSIEKGLDEKLWNPIPKVLWTIPLGTSYGGPTISQGKLFQFDRHGLAERLTCYVAETGIEIWRWDSIVEYEDMYGYNNGPRCCPIVDGDRVYVYGVAGNLACISASDGKLLWKRNLAKEFGVVQNFFGVASAPCVYGQHLFVAVGGSPSESHSLPPGRLDGVKPNGSAIVALDKMTGKDSYKLGDDLASYSTPIVRKVGEQTLGLAYLRSGLLAWEPDTGKELFRFPWRAEMLESVNAAQPVTVGSQILLSEAYEIGSTLIDAQSLPPKQIWRDGDSRDDQAFRAHWSTPVVIDGYLYGSSGRNPPDSDFRCVRLHDRHVQWVHLVRGEQERSSVLLVDGYLVVLGESGSLKLIKPNPEKYQVVASADLSKIDDTRDGTPLLESPCWAAPVLSHGLLYLRGNTKLVCLELIPTVD